MLRISQKYEMFFSRGKKNKHDDTRTQKHPVTDNFNFAL
jgi:hypothetical protein